MNKKSVGILLFDDVELLDFAGPLEVFTAANYLKKEEAYDVTTIGFKESILVNKSKLKVHPTDVIHTNTSFDLFVIPGGMGTRSIIKDDEKLNTLKRVIENSKRTASVCTGSLILAKLGFLKDKKATSHHLALDLLQQQDKSLEICPTERYIDNGRFITSAGVSAGIDMSLFLIEQDLGKEAKETTARYLEYLG